MSEDPPLPPINITIETDPEDPKYSFLVGPSGKVRVHNIGSCDQKDPCEHCAGFFEAVKNGARMIKDHIDEAIVAKLVNEALHDKEFKKK